MTQPQLDSWKKVRAAGLVALIFGWIGVATSILFICVGIGLLFTHFAIPLNPSFGEGVANDSNVQSWILGLLLLIASLVFALPFAIINIMAGAKLRKPVAKPKGWLIYMVVMGALGVTSVSGILFLIFAILALSGLHEIEGTEPPELV